MQFIVSYTLIKVYLLDEEYDSGSGQYKDHRLGALSNSGSTALSIVNYDRILWRAMGRLQQNAV
jgi:hypothetical protein